MHDRIDAILSSYGRDRANLIPILQSVQAELGYLSEEAMLRIADYLGVPESQVYGVASFYAQFRFTPTGRNRIMVCRGTACHVRGAPRILDEIQQVLNIREGETTSDMEYTLETVACIGCCALSPCMMINREVYAKLTPTKVREVFSKGGQEQ
ncbi:MAG: NADH-quinone oxidoreductase subunit NuoE [Anaerolineae bacterium]|nr:NADH-quinone oxidoreductase subunit NuoE [Anaerolineae bacterium]